MTEIQLQMSDKELSSSLTETRKNLTTKVCCLRLKMRTRQHYALDCDSRRQKMLYRREIMRFDTLCLHICNTNMADSNCRQAVSHVSENQELLG